MLNNLSAMEIISLYDALEMVEPTRFAGNEANTIDNIFFKAFGIDWDKNEIYSELRTLVNESMMLVSNQYGDYNLIAK